MMFIQLRIRTVERVYRDIRVYIYRLNSADSEPLILSRLGDRSLWVAALSPTIRTALSSASVERQIETLFFQLCI
jgi:hypothetical protein